MWFKKKKEPPPEIHTEDLTECIEDAKEAVATNRKENEKARSTTSKIQAVLDPTGI